MVAVSFVLTAGVVGTGKSQSAERLSYVAAALPENLRTCWVPLELIQTVDQNLDSLLNCNTPEDYEKVAQLSGSAPLDGALELSTGTPEHKALHP